MKSQSMLKLAESGNTSTVEEQWMQLVESQDLSLSEFASYQCVLAELCKRDKQSFAATLGWAAIEGLCAGHSKCEVLDVAAPFLLAIGDHGDLRKQVAELYREAYEGREALEELLQEAGIEKGRPVRRALRTLQVALGIKEGDYLAGRHEDLAARVDSISLPDWTFSIKTPAGSKTFGAVTLADEYRPAKETEFVVMQCFSPEALLDRIRREPAEVVIELCRENDNTLDSDELMARLTPSLLPETEWKKWWTRARTALKKYPKVKIEGRSPYELTYIEDEVTHEGHFEEDFAKQRDVQSQLVSVDRYVRECRQRKENPCEDTLRRCADKMSERARRFAKDKAGSASICWLCAARAGELAGYDAPVEEAIEYFRPRDEFKKTLQVISVESLYGTFLECFCRVHTDDWAARLLEWFPSLPYVACDLAAKRLVDHGCTGEDFALVFQRLMKHPEEGFDVLLWLWNGLGDELSIQQIEPIGLVSRIIRVLETARLRGEVSKLRLREMLDRARSVLGARRCEKFKQCVETIDLGMAQALRNQIRRADSLGQAVKEDFIRVLLTKFPEDDTKAQIPLWERSDILYVTKTGMAQRSAEIDHHLNVKMAENAKAIGAAAEHGDLSENSEYKFALEERDLLRAKLSQMNEEMEMAHVMTADEVDTDCLSIGTRAVFKNMSDDTKYEMTFFGPWEADLSCCRFNYNAPLAQRLMGLKVGETVEFDHDGAVGTYQLVAIENAIKDWDI